MARAAWPLAGGRPVVEIGFSDVSVGASASRTLMADTGAGSQHDPFDLILNEDDCLHLGGMPSLVVDLGGAYTGKFPCYSIAIEIPVLGFFETVEVVGVPASITDLDGIACFRFLNRFTYGNFGRSDQFGLET